MEILARECSYSQTLKGSPVLRKVVLFTKAHRFGLSIWALSTWSAEGGMGHPLSYSAQSILVISRTTAAAARLLSHLTVVVE